MLFDFLSAAGAVALGFSGGAACCVLAGGMVRTYQHSRSVIDALCFPLDFGKMLADDLRKRRCEQAVPPDPALWGLGEPHPLTGYPKQEQSHASQ